MKQKSVLTALVACSLPPKVVDSAAASPASALSLSSVTSLSLVPEQLINDCNLTVFVSHPLLNIFTFRLWTLMDPFTIAVSVAGLTSLGLQLLDGLNKYAGSALNSRGRITAISTDVNLANQVIKSLSTVIVDDEANRGEISDEAVNIGRDAIKQCWKIFEGIKDTLPKVEATSLRKRDIARWPFMEPKLDLLRGELEKIKATLQLLMSVVTYAAMTRRLVSMVPIMCIAKLMTRRKVEQDTLDRQQAQIKALLKENVEAEAKFEKLERDYDEAIAMTSTMKPSGPTHAQTFISNSVTPQVMLANVQPHPKNSVSCPEISETRQSRQYNQSSIAEVHIKADPDLETRDESDAEHVMARLHTDYTSCLRELKALQCTMETALRALYVSLDS